MQIVYLAGCYSTSVKEWSKENVKNAFQLPGDKFHNLIVKGFALNGVDSVHVISQLQITPSQVNQKTIKFENEEEDGVIYHYLKYVRFPIVKNFLAKKQLNRTLKELVKKDRETVIICDVLNLVFSQCSINARKKYNARCFGIITDLPKYVCNQKNIISRLSCYLSERLIGKYEGNVVLTNDMRDDSYVKKSPSIVVEGVVDYSLVNAYKGQTPLFETKQCLYAGGIFKEYGVDVLVEAFKRISDKNIKLCIYGNGSYVEELRRIIKDEPNIKYCGVVSNNEILIEENKSELLINPRPNSDFTKYSFPSKNMEYMASGVPMLGVRLPGIPEEYFSYMILANECDEDIFKSLIEDYFKKTQEERKKIGANAQRFVLEKKNNKIQSKRILDFVESVAKEEAKL